MRSGSSILDRRWLGWWVCGTIVLQHLVEVFERFPSLQKETGITKSTSSSVIVRSEHGKAAKGKKDGGMAFINESTPNETSSKVNEERRGEMAIKDNNRSLAVFVNKSTQTTRPLNQSLLVVSRRRNVTEV